MATQEVPEASLVGPRDKQCGVCGRAYDRRAWQALPMTRSGRGPNPRVLEDDDGLPFMVIELRECPCGNSLAHGEELQP